MPKEKFIVIKPYWYEGEWVFDDAKTGVQREPFITGITEMITLVVRGIPNARAGVRLICCEQPLPGARHTLTWVRAEAGGTGGNYYRLDNLPVEGWMSPAMYRYFDHTPAVLNVRADPLD